jgi:hypothetical protein
MEQKNKIEVAKYNPPKGMIYLKIDQTKFSPEMESKLLSWQYFKMQINMKLWKK